MVALSTKKIEGIFDELQKIAVTYQVPLELLPHLPIFSAIENRVKQLLKLQNLINLSKIDIKDAVDTLLILDIDSVSALDRKTFEIVMKAGRITRLVQKHLAFDPEYTVPRARSLGVVKATRDLFHKFKVAKSTWKVGES